MVVAVVDVAVPFLCFLCSSVAAFLLVSQTLAPRLTPSHYLSLFNARYSRQLGVILKDFRETFSVSLKRFFGLIGSAFPKTVRRRAVCSGGGDLSSGQHDQPNKAVIASR